MKRRRHIRNDMTAPLTFDNHEEAEDYANRLYDRLADISMSVGAGYDSSLALLLREGIGLLGRDSLGQRIEDERCQTKQESPGP